MGCLGWQKCVPVLGIPKKHIPRVNKIGYVIYVTLGAIYISFPVFCMLTNAVAGGETALQAPKALCRLPLDNALAEEIIIKMSPSDISHVTFFIPSALWDMRD